LRRARAAPGCVLEQDASCDLFAAPFVQKVKPTPTSRVNLHVGPWLPIPVFLFKTVMAPKPVSAKTVVIDAPPPDSDFAAAAASEPADGDAAAAAATPAPTMRERYVTSTTILARADDPTTEGEAPPDLVMAGAPAARLRRPD